VTVRRADGANPDWAVCECELTGRYRAVFLGLRT